MANRTVKDAHTIKGTNPQYLIEKIIRERIYECRFWKEDCFALTAELLVDKAMELRYIGGTFGGNIKPAPFLCLILKMLQIQPEKEIIIEFIKNDEYKYVRALGAFYLRLTGTSMDCYKYLEPLLNDFRKIRCQGRDGKFVLSHMDEFIDELLMQDRALDNILPPIQKRHILEDNNEIEPRVSILEEDLDNEDSAEDSDSDGEIPAKKSRRARDSSEERSTRRRERSRSRERDRRRRSRSRSKERRRHRDGSRERSSKKSKDRDRSRERSSKSGGGGGAGKDSISIEETNKLRASLGLAPLKQ